MFFPEAKTAMWMFEALIHWVRDTLVSPDRVFVDIGAHVGTYALVCGKKARATHAFECGPQTFCYLAANIALHGLTAKVTLHSCALGACAGTAPYYVRSADGGGNGVKALTESDASTTPSCVSVPVATLDSFALENVGCVKIDVEGFEKDVLVGAQATLRRSGFPPIVFESWGSWKDGEGVPATALRAELFAYLVSTGYQVQPLTGACDMFLATHK